MSGSEPRNPTEALGAPHGSGGLPAPPAPPPKFLLPPPPALPALQVSAAAVAAAAAAAFVAPPPQAQALPLVIKSEPTSEDDHFLRSPQDGLDTPPGLGLASQNRKRYAEESSHDEIIKSEFGHTGGRSAIPSGRTILGTYILQYYTCLKSI